MKYELTRNNLETAHIALEYAIADAVEELSKNGVSLNYQGRVLLNSIEFAKTVVDATFNALGNLETDTDAATVHTPLSHGREFSLAGAA